MYTNFSRLTLRNAGPYMRVLNVVNDMDYSNLLPLLDVHSQGEFSQVFYSDVFKRF